MNDHSDPITPDDSRGFWADGWLTEEHNGISRLGLRTPARREEALLHEETSEYQHIAVYQSSFFGRILTLDGLFMFTERDEFVYHEMLVHVPLCSISTPRDVLIIGGGDGGCAREARKHPSVRRIVQCDIDERVTAVCEAWFPWMAAVREDPRVELVFDDGVRYVADHASEFDLIIVDSTDPIGPAKVLFSRDFYGKVRRALRPGGVVTAQTESPHWSPNLVGQIHGELRAVFPEVHGYLGAIPTYPSGIWSWAWASPERAPANPADPGLAHRIAESCLYYNLEVHRGAFALPGFARRAMEGANPFARFEEGTGIDPPSRGPDPSAPHPPVRGQ